jgi:hypothetical protein
MEISKFLIFLNFFNHFILISAKQKRRSTGGAGWKFSSLSPAHYQCAAVVSPLSPAHKGPFAGGNFLIIIPGAWALIRQW